MASVVRVLDLALRRENFEAAAAEVDAISPGTAQLLALRYLGEAHILFGAPADAVPILQRYPADISNISSPPSRLGHLGNVAWLLAEAGDEESAAQAVAALLEIANSQPIAQLRPIFSMDAAAAESLLVGTSAGAARIEAALDALYALSNLPPGFTVETQAIAVKNYGRLGLTSEGRALAQQVLTAIDEVDSDRQGEVLRNLDGSEIPLLAQTDDRRLSREPEQRLGQGSKSLRPLQYLRHRESGGRWWFLDLKRARKRDLNADRKGPAAQSRSRQTAHSLR